MRTSKSFFAFASLLLSIQAMVACGSAPPPAAAPIQASRATPEPVDTRGSFSGLMGTISEAEVRRALDPKMRRFTECFAQGMRRVEFLSGDVRFSFRIHTDGTVKWVYLRQSSVGDLETERCVLGIAQGTRFSEPVGGEAEFRWGFGMDAPDDIRPPVATSDAVVVATLGGPLEELRLRCSAPVGLIRVTAYVQPGGAVLTAGAFIDSDEYDESVVAASTCIAEGIRAIPFPDPGSYAGKVSFLLNTYAPQAAATPAPTERSRRSRR